MQFRHSIVVVLTLLLAVAGMADPTPPIQPQIQETPLPPAVTLPAPPQQRLSDVPNRPLTALEAAEIALRHQPALLSAAAAVEAAMAAVQQAKSHLGPSVVLNAGYTAVPVANGSAAGSSAGFQFGATVDQLLYDFNHTRDLVRQSFAVQQSAQATLTQSQSDVVYQTKQAFYTYAEDLALIKVNAENVQNSQNHLALSQAQVAAGTGLPSDVVTAQTAVANAIFNLNLAQNTASIAKVSLAVLMGIDPRTPILPADSVEHELSTADLNAQVAQALIQRPEVLAAQATLQSTLYALGAAKSSNAPTIGAFAGWDSHGLAVTMGAEQSLGIGITLSWTPYNSGLTKGQINQAKANIVTAQAQLTSTQQSVISDVSQAYLNLMTAQQRVTTADAEVKNAQEALDMATGRFKAGIGVFLDVLDDESALTTALTDQVNAQTGVQLSRAAFAHALYEDQLAPPVPPAP